MSYTMHVYFIQAGKNGPIKIGTSADPCARLQALQHAHFLPLTLLAIRPGDERLERHIHGTLAKHRIRGEWFRPAPDVLSAALDAAFDSSPPLVRDGVPSRRVLVLAGVDESPLPKPDVGFRDDYVEPFGLAPPRHQNTGRTLDTMQVQLVPMRRRAV